MRLYYTHNKSVACTMYYVLKQLIRTYMSNLVRRARFFNNLHQVHSQLNVFACTPKGRKQDSQKSAKVSYASERRALR